jgi:hypothetical protein
MGVWVNIILSNVSLLIVLSLIIRQGKRITELEYEVTAIRTICHIQRGTVCCAELVMK